MTTETERSRMGAAILPKSPGGEPSPQALEALVHAHLGPPAELLRGGAYVRDVHPLIPRPPLPEADVHLRAALPQPGQELEQGKGVLRSAADVEDADRPLRERLVEGLEEIAHVEDVAH